MDYESPGADCGLRLLTLSFGFHLEFIDVISRSRVPIKAFEVLIDLPPSIVNIMANQFQFVDS